jgi:tetratricopeptide (TPR) repeat protein
MTRPADCRSLIAASALFRALPEDWIDRLARNASQRPATPDDGLIFRAGAASEPCLYLIAPQPGRSGTDPGPLVQIAFDDPEALAPRLGYRLMAGEVAGDLEFLLSGLAPALPPRCASARMLRPLRLVILSAADIAAAAAAHEPFRRRLLRDAARRLIDRLSDRRHAEGRPPDISFARGLLDLFEDFGLFSQNRASLRRRMSQQAIADLMGISLRSLSFRATEWMRRGLIETAPFALIDTDRIRRIAEFDEQPAPRAAIIAANAAQAALAAGDALRSAQIAADAALFLPGNPALGFAAALASARLGDAARAGQLLAAPELAWNGTTADLRARASAAWLRSVSGPGVDEEDARRDLAGLIGPLCRDIGALHGRLAKDAALALPAGRDRTRALARAAAIYAAVDEGLPNAFCAVNAATLSHLAGDGDRARAMARRALSGLVAHDDWAHATEGEARLLLGQTDAALAAFDRARVQGPGGSLGTARRQIAHLAQAGLPGAIAALERLDPGALIVFTGPIPRATTDLDAVLAASAARIGRWLDETPVAVALSSLAAGADILFAEAALARGIPVDVVLPFPPDVFESCSVAIGGPGWSARFRDCLSRARDVICLWGEDAPAAQRPAHFHRANRHMLAEAMLHGRTLHQRPTLLTMAPMAGHGAFARAMVADARRLGLHLLSLPFAAGESPPPPLPEAAPTGPLPRPFGAMLLAGSANLADEPALTALLLRYGFDLRRGRGQHLTADLAGPDPATLIGLARAVQADAIAAGLALRLLCDFGPVLGRLGTVNREAFRWLEGPGLLSLCEPGEVLATTAACLEALAGGSLPALFVANALTAGAMRAGSTTALPARRLFRIT